MTSVPKPLKFLRPHYKTLKTQYEKMPESELKVIINTMFENLSLFHSIQKIFVVS